MRRVRLPRNVHGRPAGLREQTLSGKGNDMPPKKTTNGGKGKRVTRYTYDKVMEPRTPETGHTALLPADEQVVTLPMHKGWSKAIKVGHLPATDHPPDVVDID